MKHQHHIIPKHMGGTDDPSNLVEVTIEQHAELHKQLWEDLGHWQDRVAWQGLSGILSSDEVILETMKNGFRGRTHTDETKKKMSDKRKGLKKTDEHKRNLSNRTLSLEHKQILLESNRNRIVTEEHRTKLRNHNLGKTLSDETKQKIRLGNLGKKKNRKMK